MAAAEVFGKLNARQREAACFDGARALLILAGAGTGKTNTLAHRVAHLVLGGVAPERLLLLTFTRRAALEMTRRAQRIVAAALADESSAPPVRLPWAGTFHSVANRLIRKHCHRLGLAESFSVLDRGDAADLVDLARHELGLSRSEKRFPRKDTCLAIYSHKVNTQGELRKTLDDFFPWCADWELELKNLFRKYVEKKLETQALDYDDLLLYWHAMMGEPTLAAEIGALFDHVLVDEYQDTNTLQAGILERLRPQGRGLTVVGDDAQAIYSFRAATVENILSFREAFSAAVVPLEENYRSTQRVLDAANAVIGKSLYSRKPNGDKPRYVTVADDSAQAQYVVERVLETRERGMELRRQAVLFRSSHHSDVLELELVRRNIPYVKYGGLKFLEAAHVKDLLAVLRWADNPRNRVGAFRVLQLLPGVGPATAERVFTAFEANGSSWSALRSGSEDTDALLRFLGDPQTPWNGQVERVREWYEPHLERKYDAPQVRAADLVQLEKIAATCEKREAFLTEMALDPPQATGDLAGAPLVDEDYLVLSTVHSAKGQEWDSVHVLNVSDGNFPNEFSAGKPELIDEERRLLYVAMTRAKTELHLIAPLKYYVTSQSRMGDRHVYGAKSRFLTREVMACLEPVAYGSVGEPVEAQRAPVQLDVASALRGMWS
ncbi:MAG: ATP-dependent helicase [Betaproteobacteria bacterium]|nr:ATP-dependent helicase [Betaproteobacteria bacterium]